MQLHEANDSSALSVESKRKPGRAYSATFVLADKRCFVVREDELDGFQKAQGATTERARQDTDNGPQVVGELVVEGIRYLVLCRIPMQGRPGADASPTVAGILTRRELQIALLIADGRQNKQVAHHLKVSEWTVSTHLRRIYAKLRVRTRAAMVARVMRGQGQE